MEIRKMKNSDWPSVAQIYQQGMDTGFATFEKVVPSFEVWDAGHLQIGRLVAAKGDSILGWAALSPVSSRCVYGGVAEVSVYIGQGNRGRGVGKMLMQELIVESEKAGLWTLQSGIFPENKGSVELHLKMGFRFIGKRERVGKRDNVWKDNLLFERRSTVVGVD
ncbi:GNAT family N-acetyltransferase [Arenibacter algicola]|uniref:GNAT family N-acetyltransferase n=1 Tax=Arenibacter algicola TaxID=616991 RepID=UPI001C07B8E2|nr:GNAT family N-acetyltransferase [Arenibacter algicola]MBU2905307.1 GNAT family N-acetyltransferase [Arenibacter algicola]